MPLILFVEYSVQFFHRLVTPSHGLGGNAQFSDEMVHRLSASKGRSGLVQRRMSVVRQGRENDRPMHVETVMTGVGS